MANRDGEWKSVVNAVYLDGQTKDWVVQEANKEGVSVSDFIGTIVEERHEECIIEAFKHREGSNIYYHHWFELRAKKLARVKRAAARYLDDPDDDAREALEVMCQNVGRDVDEIIAGVEDNPFAAIVARERSDSKRGECVLWLSDILNGNDGEVEACVIYDLAKAKGFSNSTLNRAKSDINGDPNTPVIVSDRDGAKHVWRLVEH